MTDLRVLITRLSHLGDCITAMPLACALRRQFPQAFIGWVVEKPGDKLLANHPAVDYVLPLSKGWLKSPARVKEIRRELRAQRFEVAIDPQSLTKSSVLGWLSGAEQRIGLQRPWGKELSVWLNNDLIHPAERHVTLRTLALLEPLGVTPSEIDFQFPETPFGRSNMESFVKRAHLSHGFALVNPGAGWASRRWPPERFGLVARHLGFERGITSVVAWAGEAEREMAEKIIARSGGHALLAPPTDLLELGSLLRLSRFYLGGDTGPMHIAVAVGAQCIVLHGATLPEDSGALGSQHVAIQTYHQNGRNRRRAGNDAMRAISVEQVCDACDQVLAARPVRAAA
ncbi:glycosyltransferase family 9 protein [Lignipirellula cremea]|uniref:Lipopolysaccharide heptosyltransferase 1 n=1 Tax=Lignipirellula cremea TaxID=2528010 RepID=A0A518DV95_9BACT|nr:glycosyltransferase family 9 protein [Lignipirellula cremea]QDU95762.1 Lipopolysaccharide heptosyltransferase 1 [Lignipirellula cremea]